MQTPSAILPVISDSPAGMFATVENPSLKQLDSENSAGFSMFLAQALTPLASDNTDSLATSPVQAGAAPVIETLPQGGKLLPLIRDFLQGISAEGLDTTRILDQVAAKIQQLQKDTDLNPAQLAVAAWYQVAADLAGQAVPGADTLQQAIRDVLGRELPTVQAAGGLPTAAGQPAPHMPRTAESLPLATQGGEAPQLPPADSQGARQSAGDAFERMLGQSPAPTLTPEQRQNELAGALAALKRLAAGNADRPGAAGSRADVTLAPLSNQPTVQPASAAPVTTVPLSVDTPLNQANWAQSMGERVQWMIGQRLQGAQIRLNPAHLGPMEVRVQIQNDQASIQFTAAHAVVRDALETALPRLREMLENSGVQLVDVDISGQSFAEQRRERESAVVSRWNGSASPGVIEGPVAETPVAAIIPSGRLDLFV